MLPHYHNAQKSWRLNFKKKRFDLIQKVHCFKTYLFRSNQKLPRRRRTNQCSERLHMKPTWNDKWKSLAFMSSWSSFCILNSVDIHDLWAKSIQNEWLVILMYHRQTYFSTIVMGILKYLPSLFYSEFNLWVPCPNVFTNFLVVTESIQAPS